VRQKENAERRKKENMKERAELIEMRKETTQRMIAQNEYGKYKGA
jgi:hypothetical protein